MRDKLIMLRLQFGIPCDADMLLALAQSPHLRQLDAERIDLRDLPDASIPQFNSLTTLVAWDHAARGRSVVADHPR